MATNKDCMIQLLLISWPTNPHLSIYFPLFSGLYIGIFFRFHMKPLLSATELLQMLFPLPGMLSLCSFSDIPQIHHSSIVNAWLVRRVEPFRESHHHNRKGAGKVISSSCSQSWETMEYLHPHVASRFVPFVVEVGQNWCSPFF